MFTLTASAVPSVAGAATISRSFSSSDQIAFRPGLCIIAASNGTIAATRTVQYTRAGAVIRLSNPRITRLSLAAWSKSACNTPLARDVTPFRWITIKQHFYGYRCSFNPTFTLGAPWSASVSVTPDCGQETTGNAGTHEAHARHRNYFLFDTDHQIGWKQSGARLALTPDPVRLCTSSAATVKFRLKSKTTSETYERVLAFKDPCISDTD